jgi:hypothetical protein
MRTYLGRRSFVILGKALLSAFSRGLVWARESGIELIEGSIRIYGGQDLM